MEKIIDWQDGFVSDEKSCYVTWSMLHLNFHEGWSQEIKQTNQKETFLEHGWSASWLKFDEHYDAFS